MSKISEEQALDQLRMLSMMGEDEAALEEVKGYGLYYLAPGDLAPGELSGGT